MEEIINKIFKEKYPRGLSAEYTKEEMTGYMMAISDIKQQLSIHDVVRQSEQLCIRCGDTKEEPKDDMCMCCWQKYKNAY